MTKSHIYLKFLRKILTFSLFFLAAACPSLLYAEKIQSVDDSGNLVLENGERIVLGGIECSEEGRGDLAFLTVGKDARLEDFESPGPAAVSAVPKGDLSVKPIRKSYVYVRQAGLMLPYVPNKSPDVLEVMVNEVLLSLGAAQLRAGEDHPNLSQFQALEAEAKKTGQGIWSYEPQKSKKKGALPT